MKRPLFSIGLLSIGLALLGTTEAGADAWPRGRGAVYVYLGGSEIQSDESFSAGGSRIPFPGRDTRERRLSLYVEAGLTDRATLVLNVPYKDVLARGLVSEFVTRGIADLDARMRLSRRIGSSWGAIEAGAVVPLGYSTRDFPQLGSGKTDWIVDGSLGSSIRALPGGFVSLDAGYRFRGGVLADEIPFAVKLGAFPLPRVGTFVFARGWESRAEFSRVDPSFGLLSADSERFAAGVELYFRAARHFDVNVVWTRPFQGRNTSSGDEYAIGVAFRK